jgi:hypothetical protein
MTDREICLGGCEQLRKHFSIDFNCCTACHYDEENGYGEIFRYQTDKGFFEICCHAMNAIEEKKND